MKTNLLPALAALAALPALAADDPEAVELEPVGRDEPAWTVSVGVRAAPRVKTRAAIDGAAALRAAGGRVTVPAVPGSRPAPGPAPSSRTSASSSSVRDGGTASSSTTSTSVSESSSEGQVSRSGVSRSDAEAAAGYTGATRYDFDNGYIDLDDAAGVPGETTNWHFDDESAFDASGQTISGTRAYSETSVSTRTDVRTSAETRTTTQESVSVRTTAETTESVSTSVTGGGVSTSLSERFGDDPSASSREDVAGLELRLSRTLWENADFGLDTSFGLVFYEDLDGFRMRGRVYEGRATATRSPSEKTTTATATTRMKTEERRTRTASAETSTTVDTTETTTTRTESGTVATVISQPEFTDPSDIRNPDGSIGGASYDGLPTQPGWGTPVLAVSADRFSVVTRPGETTERSERSVSSSTTTSSSGPGAMTTSTSVRESGSSTRVSSTVVRTPGATTSVSKTVDASSRGEFSLRELRFGASPFWKPVRWLRLRADLGVAATWAETDVRTTVYLDGTPAARASRKDDEWTAQGYAGLSASVSPAEWLELSAGAEARFPTRRVHFDDGLVSGSVELARWDAFVAVGFRF